MIIIRKCEKSDIEAIMDICYKTGYMGKDLSGLNLFNDKLLFGYLFCLYYPKYESSNCYVAVDTETNKVAGYIIGTHDTFVQKKRLFLKMGWRIVLRIIFVTSWKYPETMASLYQFIKNLNIELNDNVIYNEYPAHLHMNVLEGYQRLGIGLKLLRAFEDNIKNSAKGIHLITTNKNSKAISFYQKMGYRIIKEGPSKMWEYTADNNSIVFAKKL